MENKSILESKEKHIDFIDSSLLLKEDEAKEKVKYVEDTYKAKLEDIKSMFSSNKDENEKNNLKKIEGLTENISELEKK